MMCSALSSNRTQQPIYRHHGHHQMEQRTFLITDLQYGDAGKGSLVDYLVRQHRAHTVVRYNGGSQAAHNVITPDGRHHTFAQFGSGLFVAGTRTHLSRYMLVDPLAMRAEAHHLESLGVRAIFERTTIDRDCPVITPYQQAINRLRELARGDARHGSCGMGVGETMADYLTHGSQVVFAGDLADVPVLRRKLRFLRDLKWAALEALREALPDTPPVREMIGIFDDPDFIPACCDVYADFATAVALVDHRHFARVMAQAGTVIFEGAQGVLLDEWHGFHPYTTWSTTTLKNADTLLKDVAYAGEITRYGLVRGYMTRHGAGPFVTEDAALTRAIPDQHNGHNAWQRAFRIGHFDAVAIRYAAQVVGALDGLVVSNLDRMVGLPQWRIATHYTYATAEADALADFFVRDDAGNLTDIQVAKLPNLAHQAQLTQHLLRCTPQYADYLPHETARLTQRDLRGYLAVLADTVGRRVCLISTGPTATDKREWKS